MYRLDKLIRNKLEELNGKSVISNWSMFVDENDIFKMLNEERFSYVGYSIKPASIGDTYTDYDVTLIYIDVVDSDNNSILSTTQSCVFAIKSAILAIRDFKIDDDVDVDFSQSINNDNDRVAVVGSVTVKCRT